MKESGGGVRSGLRFAVDTRTFSQALKGQPIEEVLHSDPDITGSLDEDRVSSRSHGHGRDHDDASPVSKGKAGDSSSPGDLSASLMTSATQASVLTMLHPLDPGAGDQEHGFHIQGKDLDLARCACVCVCVSVGVPDSGN